MSKKSQDVPEVFNMSNEQIASGFVVAIPKVLAFLIVLLLGFIVLSKIEGFLETWLSAYIANKWLVTGIILAISFGPLFYLEERIEKWLSLALSKIMGKRLDEEKNKALEELKKRQPKSEM